MKKAVISEDNLLYDSYVSITSDRDTSSEEACKKTQNALHELEKDDHDFFIYCVRHKKDFNIVSKVYKVTQKAAKVRYNQIAEILKKKM